MLELFPGDDEARAREASCKRGGEGLEERIQSYEDMVEDRKEDQIGMLEYIKP